MYIIWKSMYLMWKFIYTMWLSQCVSEIDLDEDYGDDDGRDFSQCSGARYSRMYVLHVSESMCV